MFRVWGVAALALLAGCATEANYQKILQSWVGRHQDELVSAWGPPTRTAPLSNGGAVWEYVKRSETQGGGYTYYTYEPVTTTGAVSSGGQTGTYRGSTTVAVPHTTSTFTTVHECVSRFTIGPDGRVQSHASQGNVCVAEESQFWLQPAPPSAPTPIPGPTTSSAGATSTQEALAAPNLLGPADQSPPRKAVSDAAKVPGGSAALHEYPEAHLRIASPVRFDLRLVEGDPHMPHSVFVDQSYGNNRYVLAAFMPIDLPVHQPRDIVIDAAARSDPSYQSDGAAPVYSLWRGLASAVGKGTTTHQGVTSHVARRLVWLEQHKGLLMLWGSGPTEGDAFERLRALEQAVEVM